ncbi:MAG: UDP-N-acetylmuramoyl-L-alanine--D-glutamate ligase [Immundisolibacteraceae bacterium]|nr:UDP-N-acetylmuramoyl-L-alanine--D-glutamate ligase [Immundisolibacteraceae bacterium]
MSQQPIRKKALILGAGVTGISCARYLLAQGFDVTVADSRNHPPGTAELETLLPADHLEFGVSLDQVSLTGVDSLVVSPGLPRTLGLLDRARALGIEAVCDVEIFLRQVKAPVIAVTGTNGKSTLVMMIAHLLRAAGMNALAGGNLGPAALDLLAEPTPDYYLLELSSFQLEWLQDPALAVAVITNITPDHLDRYDSFADYRAAKARVLGGAQRVVLNLDDRESRKLAMTLPVSTPVDWFGASASEPDATLIDLKDIPSVNGLMGEHNRINAQAALTVASGLGLTAKLPANHWNGFEGLPHRLQLVATINGVRWLNDSKATNVGATLAAAEGLATDEKSRLVLVLGGEGKGQDFAPLQQLVPRLRAVVVTGQDGSRIAKLLTEWVSVKRAQDMNEVVDLAAALAHPGDNVLFSPACASQDQYRDYQHRGDCFVTAVKALAPKVDE